MRERDWDLVTKVLPSDKVTNSNWKNGQETSWFDPGPRASNPFFHFSRISSYAAANARNENRETKEWKGRGDRSDVSPNYIWKRR